jgi:cell division protein FtsB
VFNVDWSHPAGLRLVISVVLSFLGTAGAAWVLFHMGHIRRESKNDRRELDWPRMSGPAKVSLIGVGALVVLISVVMFVRVFSEGVLSGLNGLALLLAVLVALIMLLSAALVFQTAFRDGSPEQEDLAHYSGVIQAARQRQHRLEDDIDRLRHEREMLEGRARRYRGGVEPIDSPSAPSAAVSGPREAADPERATENAQVTRIDEVRLPWPPRHTGPAAADGSPRNQPGR